MIRFSAFKRFELLIVPRYTAGMHQRMQSSATQVVNTFDAEAKRNQRARAILRLADLPTDEAEGSDRVRDEIAYRVFDRICDVKRKFNTVLDFGCGRSSFLGKHLQSDMLNHLIQYDSTSSVVSHAYSDMLKQIERASNSNSSTETTSPSDQTANEGTDAGSETADDLKKMVPLADVREILQPGELERCTVYPEIRTPNGVRSTYLHFDSDERLPFKDNSVDLVTSSLHLQWINNLPKCFAEIRRVLKPDGAFVAATLSRDTLFELRVALQLAEMEREGGFGVHVSPFIEPSDVAGLMHRCDFRLITVDIDELQVVYPDAFALMTDLRNSAEQHAATLRKQFLHRSTLLAAASLYQAMFPADLPGKAGREEGGELKAGTLFDKGVQATFNITYLIGWKAHASQAKPAARGSGEVSLKDIAKLATGSQSSRSQSDPKKS